MEAPPAPLRDDANVVLRLSKLAPKISAMADSISKHLTHIQKLEAKMVSNEIGAVEATLKLNDLTSKTNAYLRKLEKRIAFVTANQDLLVPAMQASISKSQTIAMATVNASGRLLAKLRGRIAKLQSPMTPVLPTPTSPMPTKKKQRTEDGTATEKPSKRRKPTIPAQGKTAPWDKTPGAADTSAFSLLEENARQKEAARFVERLMAIAFGHESIMQMPVLTGVDTGIISGLLYSEIESLLFARSTIMAPHDLADHLYAFAGVPTPFDTVDWVYAFNELRKRDTEGFVPFLATLGDAALVDYVSNDRAPQGYSDLYPGLFQLVELRLATQGKQTAAEATNNEDAMDITRRLDMLMGVSNTAYDMIVDKQSKSIKDKKFTEPLSHKDRVRTKRLVRDILAQTLLLQYLQHVDIMRSYAGTIKQNSIKAAEDLALDRLFLAMLPSCESGQPFDPVAIMATAGVPMGVFSSVAPQLWHWRAFLAKSLATVHADIVDRRASDAQNADTRVADLLPGAAFVAKYMEAPEATNAVLPLRHLIVQVPRGVASPRRPPVHVDQMFLSQAVTSGLTKLELLNLGRCGYVHHLNTALFDRTNATLVMDGTSFHALPAPWTGRFNLTGQPMNYTMRNLRSLQVLNPIDVPHGGMALGIFFLAKVVISGASVASLAWDKATFALVYNASDAKAESTKKKPAATPADAGTSNAPSLTVAPPLPSAVPAKKTVEIEFKMNEAAPWMSALEKRSNAASAPVSITLSTSKPAEAVVDKAPASRRQRPAGPLSISERLVRHELDAFGQGTLPALHVPRLPPTSGAPSDKRIWKRAVGHFAKELYKRRATEFFDNANVWLADTQTVQEDGARFYPTEDDLKEAVTNVERTWAFPSKKYHATSEMPEWAHFDRTKSAYFEELAAVDESSGSGGAESNTLAILERIKYVRMMTSVAQFLSCTDTLEVSRGHNNAHPIVVAPQGVALVTQWNTDMPHWNYERRSEATLMPVPFRKAFDHQELLFAHHVHDKPAGLPDMNNWLTRLLGNGGSSMKLTETLTLIDAADALPGLSGLWLTLPTSLHGSDPLSKLAEARIEAHAARVKEAKNHYSEASFEHFVEPEHIGGSSLPLLLFDADYLRSVGGMLFAKRVASSSSSASVDAHGFRRSDETHIFYKDRMGAQILLFRVWAVGTLDEVSGGMEVAARYVACPLRSILRLTGAFVARSIFAQHVDMEARVLTVFEGGYAPYDTTEMLELVRNLREHVTLRRAADARGPLFEGNGPLSMFSADANMNELHSSYFHVLALMRLGLHAVDVASLKLGDKPMRSGVTSANEEIRKLAKAARSAEKKNRDDTQGVRLRSDPRATTNPTHLALGAVDDAFTDMPDPPTRADEFDTEGAYTHDTVADVPYVVHAINVKEVTIPTFDELDHKSVEDLEADLRLFATLPEVRPWAQARNGALFMQLAYYGLEALVSELYTPAEIERDEPITIDLLEAGTGRKMAARLTKFDGPEAAFALGLYRVFARDIMPALFQCGLPLDVVDVNADYSPYEYATATFESIHYNVVPHEMYDDSEDDDGEGIRKRSSHSAEPRDDEEDQEEEAKEEKPAPPSSGEDGDIPKAGDGVSSFYDVVSRLSDILRQVSDSIWTRDTATAVDSKDAGSKNVQSKAKREEQMVRAAEQEAANKAASERRKKLQSQRTMLHFALGLLAAEIKAIAHAPSKRKYGPGLTLLTGSYIQYDLPYEDWLPLDDMYNSDVKRLLREDRSPSNAHELDAKRMELAVAITKTIKEHANNLNTLRKLQLPLLAATGRTGNLPAPAVDDEDNDVDSDMEDAGDEDEDSMQRDYETRARRDIADFARRLMDECTALVAALQEVEAEVTTRAASMPK